MKEIFSPDTKTHFGVLLAVAQREPVTIHKKGRAVAVMLSMQDFEAHEAMKLTLLQQAIETGLTFGLSDRSFNEVIAGAESQAAVEASAEHA